MQIAGLAVSHGAIAAHAAAFAAAAQIEHLTGDGTEVIVPTPRDFSGKDFVVVFVCSEGSQRVRDLERRCLLRAQDVGIKTVVVLDNFAAGKSNHLDDVRAYINVVVICGAPVPREKVRQAFPTSEPFIAYGIGSDAPALLEQIGRVEFTKRADADRVRA